MEAHNKSFESLKNSFREERSYRFEGFWGLLVKFLNHTSYKSLYFWPGIQISCTFFILRLYFGSLYIETNVNFLQQNFMSNVSLLMKKNLAKKCCKLLAFWPRNSKLYMLIMAVKLFYKYLFGVAFDTSCIICN